MDIRPLVTISGDGSGATAQVLTNSDDGKFNNVGGTNYKNANTISTNAASGSCVNCHVVWTKSRARS